MSLLNEYMQNSDELDLMNYEVNDFYQSDSPKNNIIFIIDTSVDSQNF